MQNVGRSILFMGEHDEGSEREKRGKERLMWSECLRRGRLLRLCESDHLKERGFALVLGTGGW